MNIYKTFKNYIYFGFVLIFLVHTQCKTSKQNESCNNLKTIDSEGQYQFILTKVADTTFVLDEVLYITKADSFCVGSIHLLQNQCEWIEKKLDRQFRKRFSLQKCKEFPKIDEVGQISELKNVFYANDSSKIIISFHLKATILTFASQLSQDLLRHFQLNTYKVFNLNFKQFPLIYILNFNSERQLTENEIVKNKFKRVSDKSIIRYDTVH